MFKGILYLIIWQIFMFLILISPLYYALFIVVDILLIRLLFLITANTNKERMHGWEPLYKMNIILTKVSILSAVMSIILFIMTNEKKSAFVMAVCIIIHIVFLRLFENRYTMGLHINRTVSIAHLVVSIIYFILSLNFSKMIWGQI